MMWSRYCPGLRDTGMVSSVTGFLDFVSYMSASLATNLFADAATTIGWKNLILIWAALMVAGFFVSVPYGAIKKKKEK
jgi:sugar phosphate permease